MTEDHLGWVEISRHLQQMRVTTGLFLATVPAAIAVAFLAPYRGSSVASPLTVTLTAAAASLWIGFAANRDAGNRLEKIRRAFAVHGDESRLLRDHWLVYLAVLVRLEMMVVCGLIVVGPGAGDRDLAADSRRADDGAHLADRPQDAAPPGPGAGAAGRRLKDGTFRF